jgi:hypothetical protein
VDGVQAEAIEKAAGGDAAQMRLEERGHHVMSRHGQPVRGLAPEGAKQALAGRHRVVCLSLIVSPVLRENNRFPLLACVPAANRQHVVWYGEKRLSD